VAGTVVRCGTLAVCHGGPRPGLDPKLPRQRFTVLKSSGRPDQTRSVRCIQARADPRCSHQPRTL